MLLLLLLQPCLHCFSQICVEADDETLSFTVMTSGEIPRYDYQACQLEGSTRDARQSHSPWWLLSM